ncbi:hypothetical protein COCOR_02084 [Corallococcus coralloides DSM 2259]|uniref:Uncharacterized protein n=1 Tax=Corallococcus coralloides (strain ATCC 25202 / DSM 2259 / NBRC 100086 / M2) TaxID=1144275 RepID=H8MIY4_CORCM|nr:hypothetical protein [Corallococcus coralloides]AFE04464.1 hypothetical protein COCOR_02084 [Corallococcus coralloides DSM 2259]
MFKKKAAIALGLTMLAGSSTAWAGAQGTNPVVINTTNKTLEGSLGSARNSSDPIQSLDIGFYGGSSYLYGFIFAFDASGTMAACSTFDPNMIEVLKAAASDSYIKVYHDGAGTCTDIEMRKASYLEPK